MHYLPSRTTVAVLAFAATFTTALASSDIVSPVDAIISNKSGALGTCENDKKVVIVPPGCELEEEETLQPNDTSEGKSKAAQGNNLETFVKVGDDVVDAVLGSYLNATVDFKPGASSSSSCGSCSGGSPTQAAKASSLVRHQVSRRGDKVRDFGLGQTSNFDIRLELFADPAGGNIIRVDDPRAIFDTLLKDGDDITPPDGTAEDACADLIRAKVLDAVGSLTGDCAQAATIVVTNRKKHVFTFEVIDIDGDCHARLISTRNKQGYGIDVVYKSFTPAEITASPELQWQRDTVTDAIGNVYAFNYHTLPIGGGYVLSSVTLPNSEVIDYAYNSGNCYLTDATYPDGSQAVYSTSVEASTGDTVLHVQETNGTTKEIHTTSNATASTSIYGQEFYNQSSFYTKTVIIDDEVRYQYYGSGQLRRVYVGGGKYKQMLSVHNTRYLKDVSLVADGNGDFTYGSVQGTAEPTFIALDWNSHLGRGYPESVVDEAGVTSYLYYDSERRVIGTRYDDGTFERCAYNDLNQKTFVRDRLGRVTRNVYDAIGNLLTREVGLLDTSNTLVGSSPQTSGLTNLCLAAGTIAEQSSTYPGRGAEKAIDGNTDGDWVTDSMAITNNQAGAWWQATLPNRGEISEIVLHNRTDADGSRLQRFTLSIFDGDNEVYRQYHAESVGSAVSFSNIGDVVGDRVRVIFDISYGNYLQLAEVEVLGQAATPGQAQPDTFVQTPEYAVYTNEYYPAGHAHENLLRYSFDALANRSEFLYNADHQIEFVNEPDDTGAGYHIAKTFTYDSAKRLKTSTDAVGRTTTLDYDERDRQTKATYHDTSTELTIYGSGSQADLIVKQKDRNGNVVKFDYDESGRRFETITAYATMDKDGSNEVVNPASLQSIETCTFVEGTNLKESCTRDGELAEYGYDYRHRLVSTTRHPRSGISLTDSRAYVNNRLFSTTDAYGRNSYYAYRDVDSAFIRTIKGTIPSFSLPNPADVANQATSNYEFRNIAPQALITASSVYSHQFDQANVVDGIVGLFGVGEWASLTESNPWIQLNWGAPVSLKK